MFPGGTKRHPPLEEKQIHGPTHRFQEGDATDGTSCVPSGPCKITRQFPSFETQHGTIKSGTEQRRFDQTRERPYHKTIPIVFASRLLQIGDNQGPDAYDVGNDVDQMGQTQIVGENRLFQCGREDIQSRVSAPFIRLTMNSVIASPSKLPKTLEDVRCKQRLKSRRSKTG